jgi:hypothetical protein
MTQTANTIGAEGILLDTAEIVKITYKGSGNVMTMNGDAILLPVGTSATRPVAPESGMVRYNTANNVFEGYIINDWAAFAADVNVRSYLANSNVTLQGALTTTGNLNVLTGNFMVGPSFTGYATANVYVSPSLYSPADGNASKILFYDDGYTKYGFGLQGGQINMVTGNGGYIGFYGDSGATRIMTLTPTANVGIGTSTPYTKLQVNGPFAAPGVSVQNKYKRVDTKSTWSFPTAGTVPGTSIADLAIEITPRSSTSNVLITYCIFYEVTHDTIFRLYRSINGAANVEIGTNSTDSNYWSGIWAPGYDADSTSTPRTQTMMFMDSPNTTSNVLYRLFIQSSGSGASTFYLNRALASDGSASYENGISQVFLEEIAT